MLFQNLLSIQDTDYSMDPTTRNHVKTKDKLQEAINSAGLRYGLPEEWIDSRMDNFAVGENRECLFRDSVEQNVILWQTPYLIIYAAKS